MNELKKRANSFRRFIMQRLTQNIGRDRNVNSDLTGATEIKRILISRPNSRLGNLLMVTPLLQEVESVFPDSKIDLFVMGSVASEIFKNYQNVDRIISLPKKPFSNLFKYVKCWLSLRNRKYDLAINVAESSSSGRLSIKFANARFKMFGEKTNAMNFQHKDYHHMAKHPIYNLRAYLERHGLSANYGTVPKMSIKLTDYEIAKGLEKLRALTSADRKTISLFTNATDEKCYSAEWWDAFYKKLLSRHPQCNIIEVLPIENVSKIGFKAPSFFSRNIREIAGLLSNTDIFIGADSGMMHLASASSVPTVGLFSKTDPDKYEPYNELSIAFNTNNHKLEVCLDYIDSVILNDRSFEQSGSRR